MISPHKKVHLNFTTSIHDQSQSIPQKFMSTFRNSPPSSNLAVFTFIRDPFQHFESGLTQVGESTSMVNKKFNSWKLNSTDELKKILNNFLDFNIVLYNVSSEIQLIGLVHMYPMSGVLLGHNFDFIGRLESFQSDWNEKIVPLYNLSNPFDFTEGLHSNAINHPTGIPLSKTNTNHGDPQNIRHYYRLLLKQEPAYARAVCNLVLIDYICIPSYKLPRECEFLQNVRSEGTNILTNVHSRSSPTA